MIDEIILLFTAVIRVQLSRAAFILGGGGKVLGIALPVIPDFTPEGGGQFR